MRRSNPDPQEVWGHATWKGRSWTRTAAGWIDDRTGEIDPLAEDMTISNFYNFRVVAGHVEVPAGLAMEEDHLRWTLEYVEKETPKGEEWKGPQQTVDPLSSSIRPRRFFRKDYRGKPIIRVPVETWDLQNAMIGPIGIWHPEIK